MRGCYERVHCKEIALAQLLCGWRDSEDKFILVIIGLNFIDSHSVISIMVGTQMFTTSIRYRHASSYRVMAKITPSIRAILT